MSTRPSHVLSDLAPGASGVIQRVDASEAVRRRLLELGLLPGTAVQAIRRAPLGDPLEIQLRGYRLSLREAEARAIHLTGELEAPLPGADLSLLALPIEGEELPLRGEGPPLVLVAGNPNAGKTTLFNWWTGSAAKVGNYPGVTVEVREGFGTTPEHDAICLLDIPGCYSLTPQSAEETVAVRSLLGAGGRRPDAVIAVLDATSLARSLYLVRQILETGVPTVLALNMMDEAEALGIQVDTERLSSLMGVDVIPMVAARGEGIEPLQGALDKALAQAPRQTPLPLPLEPELRAAIEAIEAKDQTIDRPSPPTPAERRSLAIWTLLTEPRVGKDLASPEAWSEASLQREKLEAQGIDPALRVIEARYNLLDTVLTETLTNPSEEAPRGLGDHLDEVFTHPLLGSAIFLGVLAMLFQILFSWADPMVGLLEGWVEGLQGWVQATLGPGLLAEALADGVVAGVGNVLVFLPQIAMLFFFLALLEDVGYLARVAFLIDRAMARIGLNGKAFVPLLSGFACAIPAIMATRTLGNRRDRLLTMLVIPLASCSARLPVYVLMIAVLFPSDAAVLGPLRMGTLVMMGLYLFSLAATLAAAALFRRTILRGPPPNLVLELPPYRRPLLRNLLRTTWFRVRKFLVDAGSIILIMSLVLWALLRFPRDASVEANFAQRRASIESQSEAKSEDALAALDEELSQVRLESSYAGRLGKALEPVFRPLGYDWRIGIGVVGSFAARELFVSTLGTVFGIAEADEESTPLREQLSQATRADGSPLITPLVGFSILVFFVLAAQCMSTLAVIQKESGSWRWAVFVFVYMSLFAYFAALVVYQGGLLLGYR